jgi:hypothetical protein
VAWADPKIPVLTWAIPAAALLLCAIAADRVQAGEPQSPEQAGTTEPADTSLDLLEYLGSWDEEDVDWLMAERAVRDDEEPRPVPGTQRQEQGT